ncbi:protein CYTOKININ-RESPONSIVE GATA TRANSCRIPTION FACTOR 1 [Triticum aestivum]|uniref:protein CYTOKININ-RESPONSIVE GATA TRANSCRIPTION FACTOR 1 n=1 Tax=Triticum aestivum TaxID=4565 RepID=UPI001D00239E|nr:protein CYTOKININ-RESPONSIVE GATA TRANSCRIPTION FACTOR 1-like [Triticum aestivum]
MTTIYMSHLSTLPLMDGDQDQGHFQAFHLPKDPPILFPFMIDNPVEHQGQGYGDQHSRQQFFGESNQQFNDHMMMSGGSADVFATCSPFGPTIQSVGSDMIQRSSYNSYDFEATHAGDGSTSQWASAKPPVKMRIMKKAPTNDHQGGTARKPRRRAQAHQGDESQQLQHPMGVIRVCSDCNTSNTPLWRSGPCGPKSLCNACGIRQRKARRAMMATGAAPATDVGATKAAAPGDDAVTVHPPKVKKEKRAVDVDRSLPFKKRCKVVQDHTATNAAASTTVEAATEPPVVVTTTTTTTAAAAAPARDLVDTIGANWSKSPTVAAAACFRPSPATFAVPVPVQDEITDAAMLLMTLSCELVRS